MAYSEKIGVIEPLLEIMIALRDPVSGCPWDRKQTISTVVRYTLEEAYEVFDAVQRDSMDDLKEELGDLLLQVVFQSQIAKEQGQFDFQAVVDTICDKMVRRHPHVFAVAAVRDGNESAEHSWEQIKQQEKRLKQKGMQSSLLEEAEVHLPPLRRALKLQKIAAKVNFDWSDEEAVVEKLFEELDEFCLARQQQNHNLMEEEFGDVLFTVINLARHLQIDPEQSLYRANAKFEQRFKHMEGLITAQKKVPESLTEQEWDQLWEQAKQQSD